MTLREIRRRLKPRAPLVVAHYSILAGETDLWMSRFAAFAIWSGVEPSKTHSARAGIVEKLPILSPEEDEQLLRNARFEAVSLFYVGFTFRGRVSYT